MSKRAEQAALKAHPICKHSTMLEERRAERRRCHKEGYEQAEKDTIERVVSWLIKNVDYYIGSMEVSRCLPIKYHVSSACWADLKAFMEEE